MKQLKNHGLCFLFGICSICSFAQSQSYKPGWVSIQLNDFLCRQQSIDDPLNGDGWGDEVYFITFYAVADKNGVTKYSGKEISKVYGDIMNFRDRIRAGHANPDGKSGGMSSGSQFFPEAEFPHLKNIRLEPGDFITVIPTIWEWDNNDRQLQNAVENAIINSFNTLNLKIRESLLYCAGSNDCFRFNGTLLGLPSFKNMLSKVRNNAGNRPLGISAEGEYNPPVFALNSEIIKSQSRNYYDTDNSFSFNNQSFEFDEPGQRNTWGNAKYRLRYHFLFKEDKTTPATVPPVSSPPAQQTTTIHNKPVSKAGILQKEVGVAGSITGRWTGTFGYGNEPGTNYFSIQFNNNDILTIMQQNNTIQAKGTYTFSNGVVTGNFTYADGGVYSFKGNVSGNLISATWGRGTHFSDGGTFSLQKQP